MAAMFLLVPKGRNKNNPEGISKNDLKEIRENDLVRNERSGLKFNQDSCKLPLSRGGKKFFSFWEPGFYD